MTNNREKKLWKENDWLRVLLSTLFIILLGVAYFTIAKLQGIDALWQNFILNIIANLIPTFLLFLGAYFIFRRSDELRSEKDAEELADKLTAKINEALQLRHSNQPEFHTLSTPPTKPNEEKSKLHRQFEITNKFFDSKSKPQKLKVEFTNRGNNILQIRKVSYSDSGLGLPQSALSKNYRLDQNGHRLLIDQTTSEILPGGQYTVELNFDGKWDVSKINGWSGKWGYIFVEIFTDETFELQYSI